MWLSQVGDCVGRRFEALPLAELPSNSQAVGPRVAQRKVAALRESSLFQPVGLGLQRNAHAANSWLMSMVAGRAPSIHASIADKFVAKVVAAFSFFARALQDEEEEGSARHVELTGKAVLQHMFKQAWKKVEAKQHLDLKGWRLFGVFKWLLTG